MRYHYPTLEQFASDTLKRLMEESGRGELTCKLAFYYCDHDYEMALKVLTGQVRTKVSSSTLTEANSTARKRSFGGFLGCVKGH